MGGQRSKNEKLRQKESAGNNLFSNCHFLLRTKNQIEQLLFALFCFPFLRFGWVRVWELILRQFLWQKSWEPLPWERWAQKVGTQIKIRTDWSANSGKIIYSEWTLVQSMAVKFMLENVTAQAGLRHALPTATESGVSWTSYCALCMSLWAMLCLHMNANDTRPLWTAVEIAKLLYLASSSFLRSQLIVCSWLHYFLNSGKSLHEVSKPSYDKQDFVLRPRHSIMRNLFEISWHPKGTRIVLVLPEAKRGKFQSCTAQYCHLSMYKAQI